MQRPLLPLGERRRNASLLGAAWFLLLYFSSGRTWWGALLALAIGSLHGANGLVGPPARVPPQRKGRRRQGFPIWVERRDTDDA